MQRQKQQPLNDLSWIGAKVSSACSFKDAVSKEGKGCLHYDLPHLSFTESLNMPLVFQRRFYGRYNIMLCRCCLFDSSLAMNKVIVVTLQHHRKYTSESLAFRIWKQEVKSSRPFSATKPIFFPGYSGIHEILWQTILKITISFKSLVS